MAEICVWPQLGFALAVSYTQIVDPPCYDGRWVRAGRGCGAAELPAAEGTGGRVKTNPKTHPRPTQAQRGQHVDAHNEGGGWVKSYQAAMPLMGGHRSFKY